MPMIMDGPLEQDGFDTAAAAAAALGSQALDHEIDMGDLFGDDPAISIPPPPPSKGIAARILELGACGACQRISWSRYGPIAVISPDSKQLRGSALVFAKETGRWQLSKSVLVKLPDGYDGILKHVSWSSIGHELVATDTVGRMFLYSAQLGHSHIELRGSLGGGVDAGEMGCVAGMYWLPSHPQTPKVIKTFLNAQQEGDTWQWQQGEYHASGPSNPIEGKAALVAMGRNGKLRLGYQMHEGTWREASVPVDDMLFDDRVYLTHASFAPDRDDGLLMTTYDTQHTLRLYKIKIDWAMQQIPPQDGQQGPHKSINPTLKVTSIKATANCVPAVTDLSEQGDLPGFGAPDTAHHILTQLIMVPPSVERSHGDQQRLLPSVIAVFKHVASLLPSIAGVPTSAPLGSTSVIWTLELQLTHQGGISGAFDRLAAKKRTTGTIKPKQLLDVVHQLSTPVQNTVLSIASIRYNSMLTMAMADGSVEFWKRDTMEVMQAEYNFSSVYSLPQSGFVFTASEPVLTTELSPNECCALSLSADGDEPTLRVMQNQTVNIADPENAQQRSATAAVLALQLCGGMLQFKACQDDIYAIVQPEGDTALQFEVIEKVYSALGMTLDFVGDEAQKSTQMFFRVPWLQKLIGQQAVLGQGKGGQRSLSSKLAYVTLNIRQAAFVLMMVCRPDLSLKADIALSLGSLVQWCLDLMIYVLQEFDRLSEHLIHLLSSSKPSTSEDGASDWQHDDLNAIESFTAAENSPALLLLLCSSSRTLLRMVCRPLRHGWIHCINSEKTATTPQARAMFAQALSKYINSPICKMIQHPANKSDNGSQGSGDQVPGILLERFMQQVDAVVSATYASAGISAANRAQLEKDMFVQARIPKVLLPALKRILNESWPKFVAFPSLDLGAIYKRNISWIGFTEDKYTQQWHRRHIVDVVKKTTLMHGAVDAKRIRYCTRCLSAMEDIQPEPRWPGWVIGSMKNCVCLGNWGAVEG